MTKPVRNERLPELREFIKDNDQRLYDFCSYLLHGGLDVEDLILAIFREFGDLYREIDSARDITEASEIRIKLFQTAWQRVREALAHTQVSWSVGRDTRSLRGIDEDLLKAWGSKGKDIEALHEAVLGRLAQIDPDFRAPVVLKDVLKFKDEDAVRILDLRWGVYRHRLHRGRLELKDSLRARAITSEAKSIPLTLNPSPSH